MTVPSYVYGALSWALSPPGGDARGFTPFGLAAPAPGTLTAEHATLFGRRGRAILSPYGSVHAGVGLGAALGAYAEAGFVPDPAFHDRPDHVSLWLAVLERLAAAGERATAAGDTAAARAAQSRLRGFEERHTAPWLPTLFVEMARLSGFPLHRALAHRANAFLLPRESRRVAPRPPSPADPSAPEVTCSDCGHPLPLPASGPGTSPPAWGSTCVRCRLRADLRRSAS